ncbi:MAG TPA: hypothetical protein VFP12_04220 [Allosphingosinicella sp.]|nr:hypothetical protein [Allosphingosinicella sp.]
MSALLAPCAEAPALYLPAGRAAGGPLTGFLLAPGTSPPPSLTLAEGLTTPGWFLITAPLDDTAIAGFVAAAQVWFASTARSGALLSWFTSIAVNGLAGWTWFADPAGIRSNVSRLSTVQFGNIAVTVPPGTTVAANGDGTALSFTAAANPMQLAVTPYGARNPVKFAVDGALAIDLAGAMPGCMSFGAGIDGAGFDSLDLGLRCYTAPTAAAGYALTTRYRPFDFGTSKVALAAILDPLAPEDHTRSQFALPAAPAVPSAYRSASGATLTASFGGDFRLVISERLVQLDADGKPVRRADPIYTLVPSGTVTLANPAASAADSGSASLATTLMGGLSPVEYLAPPAAGATLTFVPDQPAFAPTLPPTGPQALESSAPSPRTFGPLSDIATTAWVKIETPAEGAAYYSQPDQAVMHQGDATASQFLRYLPMPIAALAPGPTAPVPLLPYASIAPGGGLAGADLAQFERQAWSPTRVGIIRAAGAAAAECTRALIATAQPDPPFGTTPQGLLLEFGADNAWQTLTLALDSPALPPPPSGSKPRQPGLLLRDIRPTLQGGLQTNELFLVATDGAALLAQAEIGYFLSQERVDLLDSQIGMQAASDWLKGLIAGGSLGFDDRAAFLAAVAPSNAPPSITGNEDLLCQVCGDFSLFAAGSGNDPGWEFDLNPLNWNTHQTILIFKFCKTSLAIAAADVSQWSDAATFCPAAAVTSQQIGRIIADATSERPTNPDLAYFVDTVVNDPSWTGIVALNATVPLAGLPEQMRALAAGIDPAAFQAHHVGVSTTPVTNSATSFTASPSSIFALIDYEDPKPLASSDAYGFKVNSLKVLIANSQVANFSSRVELLINELFGEGATQVGASDNNLGFNGYYQKAQTDEQGTQIGSYQFVAAQPTAYALTSYVVDQVAITGATFVTLPGTDDENPQVNAVFMLSGAIAFIPQSGFDLFSFGPESRGQTVEQGLSYRSLAVRMSFDEATPNYRTLIFDPSGIVVDPATSLARGASLVSHFPMKMTGLVAGQDGVTPDSLGFMPVDMPLQGVKLAPPWYGLRFDLDLGTAGALAAEAGFTAGLLLGWAPNPNAASVYVGLSVPGVSGGQRSISLEGVITLSFGGISFVVAPPTYLIQLSNIALKFLSVSFPSGGQVNLTLFGNPEKQSSGALGWLGAYLKNGAGQPKKPAPPLLELDA